MQAGAIAGTTHSSGRLLQRGRPRSCQLALDLAYRVTSAESLRERPSREPYGGSRVRLGRPHTHRQQPGPCRSTRPPGPWMRGWTRIGVRRRGRLDKFAGQLSPQPDITRSPACSALALGLPPRRHRRWPPRCSRAGRARSVKRRISASGSGHRSMAPVPTASRR